MIDFDNVPEAIDRLHAEAEDLADLASHVSDPNAQADLRDRATKKVRQAARLRSQIEEG